MFDGLDFRQHIGMAAHGALTEDDQCTREDVGPFDGECFALTSPYAGSDAAAIPDIGMLTEREWNGAMTEGFALTLSLQWPKLGAKADTHDPNAIPECGLHCVGLR
ncbi:hypothetical protein UB46_39115 [Burkholderiaceae bacterium 16]|nr:hypothetical protein UB46_39115 [Burkholderiaceae bacterium 16]